MQNASNFRYQISHQNDIPYPPAYLERERATLRSEAMDHILAILISPERPILTVQFKEQNLHSDSVMTIEQGEFLISRVQVHVPVVFEMPKFEDMKWKDLSHSAVEEIGKRISKSWEKLWGKHG